MAFDYSAVVIPSNPKDRTIIAQSMQEIVNSKTRQSAEVALQGDIRKKLKEEYNLPGDVVNQWVSDMMDPEKRKANEAKVELIDSGRAIFLDNAEANKQAAIENEIANTTPEQIFGKSENEPTLSDEEKETISEEISEETAIHEDPEVSDTVDEQETSDFIEELGGVEAAKEEAKAMLEAGEVEAQDTIPDVFDNLDTESEPEPEPEIAKDESTVGLFESAGDLGEAPTEEDLATVNENAEIESAESEIEEDPFADLDAFDTATAVEATAETTADDDDVFGGLDDFDFDSIGETETEEKEPADSGISDAEIDDIFSSL